MPDLKTVAKVGGKAVKAAGDVLPLSLIHI